MFHAVFLITIGLLFLGNNFGIFPWSIWANLIPYWPVLIIFAGIDAIFGRTRLGHFLAGVVNSVIFLAIIARVVGINFRPLNLIPLPKTNIYRIDQRVDNFNGRKGIF